MNTKADVVAIIMGVVIGIGIGLLVIHFLRSM